jgi:sodium/potassium/calcium exchanger 6
MAIGELIGAAGFITAVVAGSMALVKEFKVGKKSFVRDVGFFIVAASFSMMFLADGALRLWECIAMIIFYIFYVFVVVVWHWYLQKQRRKREELAANRDISIRPAYIDVDPTRESHGNADIDVNAILIQNSNVRDFATEERGGHSPYMGGTDSDDEERGRARATQVSNSMRVVRPRIGSRRSTLAQIRPSLVGAMEFRSALVSKQKAKGQEAKRIVLRRYSDDHALHPRTHEPLLSAATSEYASSVIVTNTDGLVTDGDFTVNRLRAHSMNDIIARDSYTDPAAYSVAHMPNGQLVGAEPTLPASNTPLITGGDAPADTPPLRAKTSAPPSPTISVSPPPSQQSTRDSSVAPNYDHGLAPPVAGFPGAKHLRADIFNGPASVNSDSAPASPGSMAQVLPRLTIPSGKESPYLRGRSPLGRDSPLELPSAAASSPKDYPFPMFTDSPRPMTPVPEGAISEVPSVSTTLPGTEAFYVQDYAELPKPKVYTWWPYNYLPSPQTIRAALFPTFENWSVKNWRDKVLSVVSAPSIFLLAITLPVVDYEDKDDEEEEPSHPERGRTRSTRSSSWAQAAMEGRNADPAAVISSGDVTPYSDEPEWTRYQRRSSALEIPTTNHIRAHSHGIAGHDNVADVAIHAEEHLNHSQDQLDGPSLPAKNLNPAQGYVARHDSDTVVDPGPGPDWNRWLVVVQLFTAPMFVSLIVWGNMYEDLDPRPLAKMILYSFIGSLVVLGVLVLTTRHDRVPKYRYLFCFLGFVVSIAWISTIANEVVGVLKAFGVILGISDAILGLTIFAVGNSLGDLVADITVARLGYPVMALSACFGGPMLNILLGIGVSGMYMTIREADHKHRKHPGKKLRYRPYEIDISPTLMISGATLLATLVVLLIVVPWNKWMMTRKIGYGLIGLWTISTLANVVVEVTGVLDEVPYMNGWK